MSAHAISQSRLMGPAPTPRISLTQRGRLVFMGLPLILTVACGLFLTGLLNSPARAVTSADASQAAPASVVTVASGQTLWGVAAGVAAAADVETREVLNEILELNALDGSLIHPGQQLYVPRWP